MKRLKSILDLIGPIMICLFVFPIVLPIIGLTFVYDIVEDIVTAKACFRCKKRQSLMFYYKNKNGKYSDLCCKCLEENK